MKKVTSILVVLVLVVNLIGFYVFNLVFLNQHKIQTQKHIEKKEVTHIFQFKANQYRKNTKSIHWKHSKEFSYNGKMYDVVRFEVKGKQVICYCHQDKKEDDILKGLDEAVKMHSDQQASKSNKKTDFKLFTIKEALITRVKTKLDLSVKTVIKVYKNEIISEPYLPCIAHPPEIGQI